ncbi:SET domain-containing protein SmydA-8 [Episyrphus balteatus]|uniref:SET domain-containing protein SmydA-8 n=1 Tax=Episyrphus balteatus TaxID=286459 RepID=UPI002485F612|nr:SET domain-containing protein SmydA-8 [Episyrphus balteatus]
MLEFSEHCKVLKNDTLGRYVTTTRKIFPGEVLLSEGPTLIMPNCSEKRCTNCLRLTSKVCRKCKIFLLCGSCLSHHEFECNFFEKLTCIHPNDIAANMNSYGTLKCLLLNENPNTKHVFEQFYSLESHQEKRRGSKIWSENSKTVVKPIISSGIIPFFGQTKNIDEELIQHICGAIDVNSFEIRAPDNGSMRAIYLKASLLAHQCVANTCISIDDSYQMKIYANCEIEKGDMLTYCYTNPLLSTEERRYSLMIGKYFFCNCARCVDPTELGSHMSSLVCNACPDKGFILHKEKNWSCQKCGFTMTAENVDGILSRSKEEILLAKDDIRKYENLIEKFYKVFHPNHYLIIDLKQNVAALLRTFLMNPICRPGKLVLERKTTLCEDILTVLRIIQPGISRLKAIALYEMFTSYAELNRLRFHENEINEFELLEILKQAETMLREAIRMLLYEPVNTPEGQLTKSMLKELRDLQNDMKMLFN